MRHLRQLVTAGQRQPGGQIAIAQAANAGQQALDAAIERKWNSK